MLVAVATVWPASDISTVNPTDPPPEDWSALLVIGVNALRAVVPPFLPVDFGFPDSFALAGSIYYTGKRVWLCLALAPFVLAALVWTFRKHLRFLAIILTLIAVTTGFSAAVYPAAIRHLGTVFVAFVTLLWVVRAEGTWPRVQSADDARPGAHIDEYGGVGAAGIGRGRWWLLVGGPVDETLRHQRGGRRLAARRQAGPGAAGRFFRRADRVNRRVGEPPPAMRWSVAARRVSCSETVCTGILPPI